MGSPSPQKTIDRTTVGVFLPNSPVKEPYRLLRDYARKELVNQGLADWINRANDVRLRFTPELLLRGASGTMKVATLDRILQSREGSELRAALAAWDSGRHVLVEGRP